LIYRLHTRTAFALAALSLLCTALFLALPRASADVIDRIIATVNGRIILQSDWDEALCYEALLANRRLAEFTDDERRAVLDRLIDLELLREQMKSADFIHATDSEVSTRVADARKQYPQAASAEAWQSVLGQYHLTEKDLLAHVREQIDVMRLVDAHLRPSVEIDSKSIEAYYRDQFVPKLKQAGASEVPLAEVSAKIRELLTEEKVSVLLVSWLQALRSEGHVRIPGATPSANDAGVQTR
jgi:peptidyl-prolyl cis-trans isomerase SurA